MFRDRPFDFLGGGEGAGGGGAGFFPQDFLPIEKQIFFSQSESQNIFFRTKQKQNIFF